MKISIDIKRAFLTAIACRAAAIIPRILFELRNANTEYFIDKLYFILVPLLFSLAITLTSFDRIISKNKVQIVLLNMVLTFFTLYVLMILSIPIENTFGEPYAFYLICILSGLSMLFIHSLCIKINNPGFGAILISLFGLFIPPIAMELSGHFATFFVIWETIIGLALAIIIWLKVDTQQPKLIDT